MRYDINKRAIVAFYDANDSYGWMANTFRNYPVNIDGRQWESTEHYFQAMKFPGDHPAEVAYRQAILQYKGSFSEFPQFVKKAQKDAFQQYGIPDRYQKDEKKYWADWDKIKLIIMRKIVKAKLDQHKDLEAELLALPSNSVIIEALPDRFLHNAKRDKIWADGADGSGQNQLGIIYMEELIRRKKILLDEQAIIVEAENRAKEFQQFRQAHFRGQTGYSIGASAQSATLAAVHTKEKVKTSNTALSLFPNAKPKPDSKEVIDASNQLVSDIKSKDREVGREENFIVRKGNINGTFKIGFDNDASAKKFFSHLNSLGFNNVTNYANESYPMNADGFVVDKNSSEAKYKHIVRFEIPDDALTYFKKINIENCDNLYHSIMGTKASYKKRGAYGNQ